MEVVVVRSRLEDGTETAVTNSTPSIPEFGDATELGVILTVTPTVTAGSKEIELSLSPKVSSFLGYDEEIEIPFPGVGNYSPKIAYYRRAYFRNSCYL